MQGEKPRKAIWDIARTVVKISAPLLPGGAAAAAELFLAVFPSPYASKYGASIEKNFEKLAERTKRLESACFPSESAALSDEDKTVLVILCEIAVAADRDFFVEDPDEMAERVGQAGLDQKKLLRSIRFLEESGCVKGLYHVNMSAEDVPRVRVLHAGFDRYLRETYSGYADLYKAVAWFVAFETEAKESLRYGDVIANSNFPPVYVVHVLDDLAEKGLIKANIDLYPREFSLVYGVSETLRRIVAS